MITPDEHWTYRYYPLYCALIMTPVVAIIFLANACGRDSHGGRQREHSRRDELVNEMSYHKDRRTGLCFGVYENKWDDMSVANVPCIDVNDVLYDPQLDAEIHDGLRAPPAGP